jgi:hypothetical protein
MLQNVRVWAIADGALGETRPSNGQASWATRPAVGGYDFDIALFGGANILPA